MEIDNSFDIEDVKIRIVEVFAQLSYINITEDIDDALVILQELFDLLIVVEAYNTAVDNIDFYMPSKMSH